MHSCNRDGPHSDVSQAAVAMRLAQVVRHLGTCNYLNSP